MDKNHKNNAGYIFNKRDTTNITEYVNEIKHLPFGIYRYDNLGEILFEIPNKEIITKYFEDENDLKNISGFLIVEKYNIPSRFKFILDQKINSNLNIVYTYINERDELLFTNINTGGNKFITYKDLVEIGKNKTTSLLYNDRFISKSLILTHIFPFSLFHNDTLYTNTSMYNLQNNTGDEFKYNSGITLNGDINSDYKSFYIPLFDNKNRTLISAINSNKLK